jgi:lysozyme
MEKTTEQKAIERAYKLIKRFEGYREFAYRDSAGVWTIGYGTTAGVYPGQKTDREEAEQRLKNHIEREVEPYIDQYVNVPLNADQRAALISFVYNLGAGNFLNSTLLAKLNAGDYEGAAAEFPKWNKAGGQVLRGLVRRRKAEKDLFTGAYKKKD